MKSVKITPPKGYEVDEDKSTFEEIVFKPISLTYDKICKELFKNEFYYIGANGAICYSELINSYTHFPNNAISKEQAERILAINKLVNVATYYNKMRICNDDLYSIAYNPELDTYSTYTVDSDVYYGTIMLFRSAVDAQAVIDNPNFRTILDRVYK